ncbi:MAG: class I adenylate-forming enzyme family protein [Acidimicrobiia bacterium]
MTVRPTRPAVRAPEYLQPGGAWHDLPPLDELAVGPAVVDGTTGERLSATALEQRVGAIAAGLVRAGVGTGDVVTWQLPNGPAVVALFRACWRIGAVAAPVHHRAGPAECEAALAQVDPLLRVDGEDGVAALVSAGEGSPVRRGETAVDPSSIAVVLFTSGSTGRPKAVLHTHQTLAYKARSMVRIHGLGAGDVVLMPAPMAHISGLANGVLVPVVARMTTVTMAVWDPGSALSLMETERVSFMVGPPTFFVSLRDHPDFDPSRVASLRLVSCGGAGVTPAFVDSTSIEFRCTVKRTYGSTEAPTVTTSYAGDPPERARDSDGRATDDVELRLVDDELWVRGPEVCQGYASEEDNSRFTAHGWLRTGDLASLEDGWLTITGRMGDMIIRGGENIAAGEVEAVLEAHPDVRQAVAVGYPEDRMGERVCAFVVVQPGASFVLDDARAWFEARGVTRFKWPERVETLDELPLLAAGKPDRVRLRDLAARRIQGPAVGPPRER